MKGITKSIFLNYEGSIPKDGVYVTFIEIGGTKYQVKITGLHTISPDIIDDDLASLVTTYSSTKIEQLLSDIEIDINDIINDNIITTDKTWSSTKINQEIVENRGEYFFINGSNFEADDITYLNAQLAGKTFTVEYMGRSDEGGSIDKGKLIENVGFQIIPGGGFTLLDPYSVVDQDIFQISGVAFLPSETAGKQDLVEKNQPNGYAGLDGNGKLTHELLPNYITVTKDQADSLIASNGLYPEAFYKITEVHTSLYNDGTNSGTTIILRAVENNSFESSGVGIFYNPKYNQAIDGFGLWSNRSQWIATSITGRFQANELITANNGATGQLFTNLEANLFIALTGNWATATSITGNISGATANIASVSVKSYNIGDKVIWGGYVWENTNGNVGAKTDILNLNSEWDKITYNSVHYNIAFDEIDYDYENDFITKRKENEFDNEVVWTKADAVGNSFIYSAISVFMWGNGLNATLSKGIGANHVQNSYFELVDFCGTIASNNTMDGVSSIYDNIFIQNSAIRNNTLGIKGFIRLNELSGSSYISFNSIQFSSSIRNNSLSGTSYISFNVFTGNSHLENNITIGNSFIHANFMVFHGHLEDNYLNNSYIAYNYFDDAYIDDNICLSGANIISNMLNNASQIRGNTVTSSYIQYNTLSRGSSITSNTQTTSGNIQNNDLNGTSITGKTLSGTPFQSNNLLGSTYRIGVGVEPEVPLHIRQSSLNGFILERFGGTPGFSTRSGNGTATSPTAVNTGSFLFNQRVDGYATTGFKGSKSVWEIKPSETWSDSAMGLKMSWSTIKNGTITPVIRLTIDDAGNIGVGGNSAPSAQITFSAGSALANSAPYKLLTGPLMTIPEIGALEFLTDRLYFTKTTGVIREQLAYVSDIIPTINTTTTAFTKSSINTEYPTATKGFTVIADSITGGGKTYIKKDNSPTGEWSVRDSSQLA